MGPGECGQGAPSRARARARDRKTNTTFLIRRSTGGRRRGCRGALLNIRAGAGPPSVGPTALPTAAAQGGGGGGGGTAASDSLRADVAGDDVAHVALVGLRTAAAGVAREGRGAVRGRVSQTRTVEPPPLP